ENTLRPTSATPMVARLSPVPAVEMRVTASAVSTSAKLRSPRPSTRPRPAPPACRQRLFTWRRAPPAARIWPRASERRDEVRSLPEKLFRQKRIAAILDHAGGVFFDAHDAIYAAGNQFLGSSSV